LLELPSGVADTSTLHLTLVWIVIPEYVNAVLGITDPIRPTGNVKGILYRQIGTALKVETVRCA
jgi:hypothetical protein